jgi:Bromodomain
MSDSDDFPLSQRARRRKVSSQAALTSNQEPVDMNLESNSPGTFMHRLNSKEELYSMIAKLKETVKEKKGDVQSQISAVESDVVDFRSDLARRKHEHHKLEKKVAMNQEKIVLAENELSSLDRHLGSLRAAMSAKGEPLAQAAADIQELEKLAEDLPARLNRTGFDSKDASIMTMLRSFYQEIVEKHFSREGTKEKAAPGISVPMPQGLDGGTKEDLWNVLRGARTHKAYHIFAHPVTEDIAPRYFEIIKQPMDLSTIREKLEAEEYTSVNAFVTDVKLMLDNCRVYNSGRGSFAKAADSFEQRLRNSLLKRGLEGL